MEEPVKSCTNCGGSFADWDMYCVRGDDGPGAEDYWGESAESIRARYEARVEELERKRDEALQQRNEWWRRSAGKDNIIARCGTEIAQLRDDLLHVALSCESDAEKQLRASVMRDDAEKGGA